MIEDRTANNASGMRKVRTAWIHQQVAACCQCVAAVPTNNFGDDVFYDVVDLAGLGFIDKCIFDIRHADFGRPHSTVHRSNEQ